MIAIFEYLYLIGLWLHVNLKNGHKRLQRDWTTCLKFVNHSRCKSQHYLGNMYDHFLGEIKSSLLQWISSKSYEEINYIHKLDLLIVSHWLRLSYCTRKCVQREKCSVAFLDLHLPLTIFTSWCLCSAYIWWNINKNQVENWSFYYIVMIIKCVDSLNVLNVQCKVVNYFQALVQLL